MLVETMIIKKVETSIVTSLDVAETFEKEHKRVLQDIRELGCSEEFGQHNFVPSSYTSIQNKKQPMYCMTRDGFTLLVMGYTGEKAMKFKEGYIRQFNAMEKVSSFSFRCRSNLHLSGFAVSLYRLVYY